MALRSSWQVREGSWPAHDIDVFYSHDHDDQRPFGS
jgi:hypothetical protein